METKNLSVISIAASLLTAILTIKKGAFASIKYESVEKLPKYLGLGVVTKICEGIVQMRYSYENAVNNRLEKQGDSRDFVSNPLHWGTWAIVNLLIAHKGESYLRCYLINSKPLDVTYFVDGRPATADEVKTIKDYKKAHEKSSNTQGLDNDTQVRPLAINTANIIELTCGECKYTKHEEDYATEQEVANAVATAK